MKFRNPWVDPRIVQVRPEDAQAYLVHLGWHPAGPAANPSLLLFDPPPAKEDAPTFLVPVRTDPGPSLQWMIDLVGEVARWQGRYAGDVLTDILQVGRGGSNGAVESCPHETEAQR